MSDLVWQYDTAVWYQSLMKHDEGYELERFYKNVSPTYIARAVTPLNSLGKPFVLPQKIGEDGTFTFGLSARTTVFDAIQTPQYNEAKLIRYFDDLGKALASINATHEQRELARHDSLTWTRLKRYFGTDCPDGTHDFLIDLGAGSVNEIRKLIDIIAARSGAKQLVLGGSGLGNTFITEDEEIELPVGPESGDMAIEFDVACILGELIELEHQAQRLGNSSSLFSVLGTALLKAFESCSGKKLSIPKVTVFSTLKVVLHYCDFYATYPNSFPDDESLTFLRWLVERAVVAEN